LAKYRSSPVSLAYNLVHEMDVSFDTTIKVRKMLFLIGCVEIVIREPEPKHETVDSHQLLDQPDDGD
jgi:hypothetical protein